jgi:hypothetical protein
MVPSPPTRLLVGIREAERFALETFDEGVQEADMGEAAANAG